MLVFTNKSQQPSQSELEQALGEKNHLFKSILHECRVEETVWKYYSKSSGWTLQCRQDDRNLFFIQVTQTGILVWFTLGKQAKCKAFELVSGKQLLEEIRTAREYVEGTSFKVDVATPADLSDVIILAGLKNKAVKS
jgi:hypothetical protein